MKIKGHRVFFGSWYSSIKLVNILTSKGFQVISNLKRNAKDFPDKNNIDKSSKKYAYNNEKNIIIQLYPIKEKNIFFISNFYELTN